LAITDEYTRECLALEVDRSITADRVLDILTNLFLTRGVPKHIRSDNGPEFIAQAIRRHAERAGLEMLVRRAGRPWENGYAESFFSRLTGRAAERRGVHEPGGGPLVRPASEGGAQRGAAPQQP
jgi:putative transposase